MNPVPVNWVETKIGELCDLVNGMAFKPSDWGSSGLPIVRIQNLNRPDAKFNFFNGPVAEKFIVEHGDLLFAWSGTPGTSFGAHIWNGPRAILNQHIFNVRYNAQLVHKEFFRYAINQTLDEQIAKAHGGVGLAHVTKGKFESTVIALPPLTEQRSIVAKIDSLSAKSKRARENLDHIPRLVEKYKEAILAFAFRGELSRDRRLKSPELPSVVARDEARVRRNLPSPDKFEPPFEIPSTWRWLRLPELGDLDRGKSRHRPRNDPRLFGGPYPFIQTGDVRAANRFVTAYQQTYNDFGLSQSRLWPVGTLCITIAANIAETALLTFEACFPDSVVGFIADDDKVDGSYVEFFLRTARADLETFAPATAQKNINLDILGKVRIPVAPLAEQKEIIRLVESAFGWIDRLSGETTNARKLIDHLDQAVLAKAFCGELVPQDPNDEPASVLLERIKAERSVSRSSAHPLKRAQKIGRRSKSH
jgi:type I restriction enzyme S subunit